MSESEKSEKLAACHTPVPWGLSDNGLGVCGPEPGEWVIACVVVYDRQGLAKGEGIPDEEQRANARFIVQAVNLHDALLSALKDLLPYAEERIKQLDEQSMRDLYPRIRKAALERAREAISKAEGG